MTTMALATLILAATAFQSEPPYWRTTENRAQHINANGSKLAVVCENGAPTVEITLSRRVPERGGRMAFKTENGDFRTLYSTSWTSDQNRRQVVRNGLAATITGHLRSGLYASIERNGVREAFDLVGSSAAIGKLSCAPAPTKVARSRRAQRRTTRRPAAISSVCDIPKVYPRAFAVKSWLVGGWYFDPGNGGKPLAQDPSEMLQIILNQTGQKRLSIQTVAILAGC